MSEENPVDEPSPQVDEPPPPWAPVRLTGLPVAGGTFVPSPEDFRVIEEPLYEPCGTGEHLYVRFRKEGLTTRDVVTRAARLFGLQDRDIGYAGLKDKFATTEQTISIPRVPVAGAAGLDGDGVTVLDAILHNNKLRTGHLRGNRFEMTIRGGDADAAERATAILDALKTTGVPGFFGLQRFGKGGSNVRQAFKVLKKGPRAAGSGWKARLVVSALQSAIFNDYLRSRIADDTFLTVLEGDVLMKTDSGGRFVCEDPATDQVRFDAFEVAIGGPIIGPKMTVAGAGSVPAELETAVLSRAELTIESFDKVRKLAQGTRRPLRVSLTDPTVTADGPDAFVVAFGLPAGFYATVVAAELLGY
ncbi:MAG: tRNA pseudouridine13 synthase [Myxococcota bacterium]|jgi:tRNA pseudouridine13 synthase